jgi:phosphohistidine swiveling domain-containing protein
MKSNRHVLPLDTTECSLEILGGKGRSLAKMSTAGLAVPGGFQLTTAAYRGFVADNNLQDKILELAKPELNNGRVSFESASEGIQQLFGAIGLSEEVVAEIREAYAALDGRDPAVAVRSSANAEDLPDMSFAGQQDTYLNVRGEEALLAAVRNCWASLWTPRAISYRHQMGIEQADVAMAVVVQLMVPADVSGILFTANPATGERSEIIINASFGLGEAVVGGQVTPDTFVVDRKSLTAKETLIGTKEQQIVSDGGQGVRLEEISKSERGKSSLTAAALKELASLALGVEKQFDGVPQDIEWAFSDGKLYLLQSRPITNLPPQPIEDNWEPTPPAKFMVRRQIVENMPDPVCPLFEELYVIEGLMLEMPGGSADSEEWKQSMDGPLYTTVNGVAYQRMDWKPSKFLIPGVNYEPETSIEEAEKAQFDEFKEASRSPEQAAMAKHDMALFLDSLSAEDRAAFDEMAKEQDSDTLPLILTVPESDTIRFLAHNRTQPCDQLMKNWKERAVFDLAATINQWRKVDPPTASDEQLLDGIRALGHAEGRYWSGRNGAKIFGVIKCCDEQLHHFLLENAPNHGFSSGQFLSGFPSKLMQANAELWEISKRIQANDSLCELTLVTPNARLMDTLQMHPDSGPILEAIDAYLNTYGHQGYSLDFVEPPPVEEPSPVFATLKTMVADPDYDPEKHDIEATRKREAAFEKIEEVLSGLTYWQFRYRLWHANRYYPYREEMLFPLGSAWPLLRPLAAELGKRMVDVGTFELADDTYYLKMAELRACAKARKEKHALPEYGQLAAERRELREARKRLRAPSAIPPEIIGHPMLKEVQAVNDPDGDTINGIPVSPGSVTASASLIISPAEFDKMEPSSILVCPMTTPAWTQLFAHATGLVTDIGGILGHGSIVAREYGIPAVVGTGVGTERIDHEQQIGVDGDAGVVTILSED